MNIIKKALVIALALPLLFVGCDSGKGDVIPEESESSGFSLSNVAPAEPAGLETALFEGLGGVSFEYPADWSVTEESNGVILTSTSGADESILIADLSYEVSLFLAGHGDLESSIDALVNQYADRLAEGLAKENYQYEWAGYENGTVGARASFTFGDQQAVVDVDQLGSRVFLSVVIFPASGEGVATEAYGTVNNTFSAENTEGTLMPASLTDLGFPAPPDGFYDFYSPVTGQYFIYPSEWTMINNVHDDCVMLVNDEGALMLTENWTNQFNAEYDGGAGDLESCFDLFLNECAGALEQIYGEVPAYHDFQPMATENQELIKATFNYTVSEGTGRCFAELGVRQFEGQDYVQATLCLYKIGDSYSIDLFSIIMDSIQIYYPTL